MVEKQLLNEEETSDKLKKAEKHFSDSKFWEKMKKFGKKAGSSVVYAVLLLYYTLQKPEVPAKTKAIIIGALGYFILPTDLISDLIAGIGYADDFGALGYALVQVAIYIDQDVKMKARTKLTEWFGDNVDTEEIDQKIGL